MADKKTNSNTDECDDDVDLLPPKDTKSKDKQNDNKPNDNQTNDNKPDDNKLDDNKPDDKSNNKPNDNNTIDKSNDKSNDKVDNKASDNDNKPDDDTPKLEEKTQKLVSPKEPVPNANANEQKKEKSTDISEPVDPKEPLEPNEPKEPIANQSNDVDNSQSNSIADDDASIDSNSNQNAKSIRRKRRFSDFNPESAQNKTYKKLKKIILHNPFKDINWNQTKCIYIRLTYFNKRKCRKFPLNIDNYKIFQEFVQFYFPSLINSKWHAECDQDWIENINDFNAVKNKHISIDNDERNFFLEFMIINESLPIKHVYAPKAVYVDNPYTCSYPPQLKKAANPPQVRHVAPPVARHPIPHPIQPPPVQHVQPVIPQPVQPAINPYYQQTMYQQSMYQQQQAAAAAAYNAHYNSVSVQIPGTIDPIQTNGGYTHVSYPHYLSKTASSSSLKSGVSGATSAGARGSGSSGGGGGGSGGGSGSRTNLLSNGAVCPDPTTYLPFSHAGQSTPQMRTLHKIVWVLQHQTKPLTVDVLRSCLPGKKKAAINEIDYLLSSYESYNYTKSTVINGRKSWELMPGSFPPEFWNMQWQRRG